ncbi:MAG: hypothetical protein K2N01_10715 [Lachnospiraceae bacterium]|nr:hypothetical protein [Lachnospiraceae bacterium]
MTYQEKDKKLADNKSTAYSFLLIGGGGLILVLLFALDILPLPVAPHMRIMLGTVMTVIFVIFLVIGAIHFRKISQMTADAAQEKDQNTEIREWFFKTYPTELSESGEKEQLYFKRYEQMQNHLHTRYPDLAEDYEDYLLEQFYNEIYPDA